MNIDNRATVDIGTQALSQFVREKGVSVLNISKSTGISNSKLQRSFGSDRRALRTDEFLAICKFLEVDPMRFFIPPTQQVS